VGPVTHEYLPEKYINMFTLRFGERAYAEVQERAHSRQKITYSDVVELLEEKEAQLLRLQGKAA
jgi:hypothetical protein